jgi:hypothetical protein
MWTFGPLNYKCRIIFKFKINEKKLIDRSNVKIERSIFPSQWKGFVKHSICNIKEIKNKINIGKTTFYNFKILNPQIFC